ncbi:hypothetical protein lerEdw1_003055 [Lerista edwardsae]|nr:hypothetical protein lerEdw1_003055 [Lerista edwardsae]
MMLFSLFVCVSLSGSLAQEDLQEKAFVFPTASNTAHVRLKTALQEPLTSFTVCLRSFSDLTRFQGLFSYATQRYANEILLIKASANEYRVWVGNEFVSFMVPGGLALNLVGEHVCVSWESTTGLVTFWLNGQCFPRKSLRKGFSILPEAYVLLGQDQDAFGGGFDAEQSFVGEMELVYMFGRALSPAEVLLLQISNVLPDTDYLINWRSLSYEIQGDVVVQPSLFYSK